MKITLSIGSTTYDYELPCLACGESEEDHAGEDRRCLFDPHSTYHTHTDPLDFFVESRIQRKKTS